MNKATSTALVRVKTAINVALRLEAQQRFIEASLVLTIAHYHWTVLNKETFYVDCGDAIERAVRTYSIVRNRVDTNANFDRTASLFEQTAFGACQ